MDEPEPKIITVQSGKDRWFAFRGEQMGQGQTEKQAIRALDKPDRNPRPYLRLCKPCNLRDAEEKNDAKAAGREPRPTLVCQSCSDALDRWHVAIDRWQRRRTRNKRKAQRRRRRSN